MCLAFISFYQHQEHPLVILNNRDEICERPTIPLAEWKLSKDEIEPFKDLELNYDCSIINEGEIEKESYHYSKKEQLKIYCGKDKIGGGTWLGVNNKGKFCIILNLYNKNFHESSKSGGKLSRGKIVQNYLSSKISPFNYILLMEKERQHYQPFILIVGDIIQSSEKYYCFLSHLLPPKDQYNEKLEVNSYPSHLKVIEKNTVFGISNYPLDWKTGKVLKGEILLNNTLNSIMSNRKINGNQDFNNNMTTILDADNSNKNIGNNYSSTSTTPFNQSDNEDDDNSSLDSIVDDLPTSISFTKEEESKIIDILYTDEKESIPPAPTEHINTSSIFVHPYYSKYSTKIHQTVSSSLITFDKIPNINDNSSNNNKYLMNFLQVDNIYKKDYKIQIKIDS